MLDKRDSRYGKDDWHSGADHTMLGLLFHQKGDAERALSEFRRALELRESHPEGNDSQIVQSLNNLGIVLDQHGEHDEAQALLRRALLIQESNPSRGAEFSVTLNALANVL